MIGKTPKLAPSPRPSRALPVKPSLVLKEAALNAKREAQLRWLTLAYSMGWG
jgi:hypothetical protein